MLGRFVGFCMLMGPALAILAAIVLLSAYARLAGTRYELDSIKAGIADAESLVEANDKLIAALPEDPVLTMRLAMSQKNLLPKNEEAVPTLGAAKTPPTLVRPTRHDKPAPPSGMWINLAAKLKNPPTQRGLIVLAAGIMLTAMFLFAPPEKYSRQDKPA